MKYILERTHGDESEIKVLRASKVITGTGSEPIDDGVIVVEGNTIREVGSKSGVKLPAGASEFNLGKVTLMPGMIDAHAHILGVRSYSSAETITTPHDLLVLRAAEDCLKLLKAGFTTVRDCGSSIALSLKRAINSDVIPGPSLYAAGRPLSQTAGHGDEHYLPRAEVIKQGVLLCDGPDDCRRAARETLRDGADLIKVSTSGGVGSEKDNPWDPQFTVEEIKAITYEAHVVGKRVATHAQGAQGIKNAIIGGVDTVEHGFFLDDECIKLMLEHGISYVPTFALVEVYKRAISNPYDMPEYRLRKQRMCIEAMPRSLMMAYKAGVKIATGPDYFGAALREHGDNADELLAMVKYGMKPMDVIVAATKNGAECIGIQDKVGTLAEGKTADIIALQGDPLQEIEAVKRVCFVMKGGSVFYKTV
ncbi:MAG: amidohydrolase family protein [Candidatus Bathyarchaeota archaeon]|nr:amidohydrolase family protein [Candidatus Bathyarchaeota archaeon]